MSTDSQTEQRKIQGDVFFMFSNPIEERHNNHRSLLNFKEHHKNHHVLLNFKDEKTKYINATLTSKIPFGYRFLGGANFHDFAHAIVPPPNGIAMQPSVVHLSSHGGLTEAGETELLFEHHSQPNKAERVTTDDIREHAINLVGSNTNKNNQTHIPKTNVKLIVLNCCNGSKFAQWLCDAMGAKHVIASDREISDIDAINFFHYFYACLFRSTDGKYDYDIQTAFNAAKSQPKGDLGFKLYPEVNDDTDDRHKEYIFPLSLLQQPSKYPHIYPHNASGFERSAIPRHLPPYDPFDRTEPVDSSTLFGHLSFLSTNLNSMWDCHYNLNRRWSVFLPPTDQKETSGWGRRTGIRLIQQFLSSRPRFNIGHVSSFPLAKYNNDARYSDDSILKKALDEYLQTALNEADEFYTKHVQDDFCRHNRIGTKPSQLIISFTDMGRTIETSVRSIVDDFFHKNHAAERFFFIATVSNNDEKHIDLNWKPTYFASPSQENKADCFLKGIVSELEYRPADIEFIATAYKESGGTPLDKDLDEFPRITLQLRGLPCFADQSLNFPKLNYLISHYNNGKSLESVLGPLNQQMRQKLLNINSTPNLLLRHNSNKGRLSFPPPQKQASTSKTTIPSFITTIPSSPIPQKQASTSTTTIPSFTTTIPSSPIPQKQVRQQLESKQTQPNLPISATRILVDAFVDIKKYPHMDDLLPVLKKLSVDFTGTELFKFEADYFSSVMKQYTTDDKRTQNIIQSSNGDNTLTCSQEVLDKLVPVGTFFNMCSEKYQQDLRSKQQTTQQQKPSGLNNNTKESESETSFSFQKLRHQRQCFILSYREMKMLVSERSPLIQPNTIAICFFDLESPSGNIKSFRQFCKDKGRENINIQSTFLFLKYTTEGGVRGWLKIFCLSVTNGDFYVQHGSHWLQFNNVDLLLKAVARSRVFLTLPDNITC